MRESNKCSLNENQPLVGVLVAGEGVIEEGRGEGIVVTSREALYRCPALLTLAWLVHEHNS